MIFALANPWRMVAKVYLRILANPCESLRNHELRKLAKHARKLAKACEIIFANACETLVLLRKHICESLRKHMHFALANPCENTICETLRKVYLLLPPPGSGRARSTRSISVVILNVFRLFVITIPKPIVSVVFLSFVCPKSFIIQVCQPTCEEIQLHSCFKSIRSCVKYLT